MVQYVSFYNCNRYSCFTNNATDFSEIASYKAWAFLFPIFLGVLRYLFTVLLKQLPSKMGDPIQFSWLGSCWILLFLHLYPEGSTDSVFYPGPLTLIPEWDKTQQVVRDHSYLSLQESYISCSASCLLFECNSYRATDQWFIITL